jgi:hypothetical protein
MNEVSQPQSGGINVGGSQNTLTITGDMVGGNKVVNVENITYRMYLSGELPPEVERAFFGKEIGFQSIRRSKFEDAQFDAYNNTWKSLQALRLTGDDLWQQVSADSLLKFANQLRDTKRLVYEGELFFEPDDRAALLEVIKQLSDFQVGKQSVLDTSSKAETEEMLRYFSNDIQQQIVRNGKAKAEYERLLEQIGASFHRRLSS